MPSDLTAFFVVIFIVIIVFVVPTVMSPGVKTALVMVSAIKVLRAEETPFSLAVPSLAVRAMLIPVIGVVE